MLIRALNNDDLTQYNEVGACAFVGAIGEEDNFVPQRVLGAFDENGVLCSQMECTKRSSFISGVAVPCAAVGGVASRPEARGNGSVRLIFEHLMKNAQDDGFVVSALHPFSVDFYRKFGYEPLGNVINAEIPFASFKRRKQTGQIKLFSGKEGEKLLSIYKAFAAQHNLMFERNDTSEFFSDPYHECCYTYWWEDENNQPQGYVSVVPNRGDSVLSVKEFAFLSRAALEGLLAFIFSFSGNYKTLRISGLPSSSPVVDFLGDRRHIKTSLGSNFAARILQLEPVLRLLKYPQEQGFFSLKMEDFLPWNQGVFTVEYGGGSVKLAHKSSGEADVVLSAAAAARLLLSGEVWDFDRLSYLQGCTVLNKNPDLTRAILASSPLLYADF